MNDELPSTGLNRLLCAPPTTAKFAPSPMRLATPVIVLPSTSDDEVAVTMQETGGDLSRDEITQEIESMNDEQHDAMVALFWIGRGDREPAEWEVTKAIARQQHEGLVSHDLLGQPDVRVPNGRSGENAGVWCRLIGGPFDRVTVDVVRRTHLLMPNRLQW